MVSPALSSSPSGKPRSSAQFGLLVCLALAAVLAAYANHFHNGFHFDDSHAIVENAAIRSLGNIPSFFRDARTFSTMPSLQTWRPLLTTSFAFDYFLGRGLRPEVFQASTFAWFVVQLALMMALFRALLDATLPQEANRYLALFATAVYAIHPVSAETVNYIYQRAELLSTLGVVAALVTYIRWPQLRKFGLYVLPALVGALAKPPAVMFAPILAVYILLFEEDGNWAAAGRALAKSLPAFAACGMVGWLDVAMNPKSFVLSSTPHWMYWAAQPYVVMRYVRSFFVPLWLTADSDLQPFAGVLDPRAVAGILFCAALAAAMLATVRWRRLRPISFGLAWFFLALLPTSALVLGEVENDHRMFFPFVGLVLAVTWAAALAIGKLMERIPRRRTMILRAVQAAGVMVLLACAVGTRTRNEVWSSDESLWRDVTLKSPHNGRGLTAYGVVLMNKGDVAGALQFFERAKQFTPNYHILEINLGNAYSGLQRDAEAEPHFKRAIALAPDEPEPYFYYGRWLLSQRRAREAVTQERIAIEKNPATLIPRYMLMRAYTILHDWASLRDVSRETLQLVRGDEETKRLTAAAEEIEMAERDAALHPTGQNFAALSNACFKAGDIDCAAAAMAKAQAIR